MGGRSALSDDGRACGGEGGRAGALTCRAPISPCRGAQRTRPHRPDRRRARHRRETAQFPGAFVRHMAVMATLAQGLTLAEARELATKERERSARRRRSTRPSRRWLTRCRIRRERRRRAHSARHRRRGRDPRLVRARRRHCGERPRPGSQDRGYGADRAGKGECDLGPDRAGFRRRRLRGARPVA